MTKNNKRLRELDFLRGVAIILVLFRHTNVHPFLHTLGWIGVDLFFVLSGYLVSGLLYKEFKVKNTIDPINFLIRRGFKIYPIYYVTLIFYGLLMSDLVFQSPFRLFGDLVFFQNYINGWGYLYSASWSLAIEEHFYFLLALVFWLGIKKGLFQQYFKNIIGNRLNTFEIICIAILCLCLILRIFSNYLIPEQVSRNFTMTHLRIDSLLAGVILCYWVNFRKKSLIRFVSKHYDKLSIISLTILCWTPFLEPMKSVFVRTFGFTILYISFSIILAIFLIKSDINKLLNKYLSSFVVNFIARIGVASYSIYVIHMLINEITSRISISFNYSLNSYQFFIITTFLSISAGFIINSTFEFQTLRLRNKYFPSKSN